MNEKKRALGRGLSVLLENADDISIQKSAIIGSIINIPVDLIEANPYQPRNDFEQEASTTVIRKNEKYIFFITKPV